jgi:RNA polymerase sigma-70 factor, ECF subfamily
LNVQIITKNLEVVMVENDRFIIRQCLDGRPDEFRHLIRRYQSGVLAFLSGKLKDKNLVDEAAQETFVRAYFYLSTLRSPEKFHSWLLGIANRVAKEQLRDRHKVQGLEGVKETTCEDTDVSEDFQVKEAIVMLDEPYRQVVLLRFYSEQSCQQIAENLNIPIGTVTKQLSRAYEKLRSLLEEKNEA